MSLAFERVGGELLDLQAGGLLAADVDPIEVAEQVRPGTRRCGPS